MNSSTSASDLKVLSQFVLFQIKFSTWYGHMYHACHGKLSMDEQSLELCFAKISDWKFNRSHIFEITASVLQPCFSSLPHMFISVNYSVWKATPCCGTTVLTTQIYFSPRFKKIFHNVSCDCKWMYCFIFWCGKHANRFFVGLSYGSLLLPFN